MFLLKVFLGRPGYVGDGGYAGNSGQYAPGNPDISVVLDGKKSYCAGMGSNVPGMPGCVSGLRNLLVYGGPGGGGFSGAGTMLSSLMELLSGQKRWMMQIWEMGGAGRRHIMDVYPLVSVHGRRGYAVMVLNGDAGTLSGTMERHGVPSRVSGECVVAETSYPQLLAGPLLEFLGTGRFRKKP